MAKAAAVLISGPKWSIDRSDLYHCSSLVTKMHELTGTRQDIWHFPRKLVTCAPHWWTTTSRYFSFQYRVTFLAVSDVTFLQSWFSLVAVIKTKCCTEISMGQETGNEGGSLQLDSSLRHGAAPRRHPISKPLWLLKNKVEILIFLSTYVYHVPQVPKLLEHQQWFGYPLLNKQNWSGTGQGHHEKNDWDTAGSGKMWEPLLPGKIYKEKGGHLEERISKK